MSQLSILVIDDDKSFLETFGDALRQNEWVVDVAESGFKAIEMVKANKYDIAFIDVNMPGIDVVETFSKIKALKPDIVVFLVTAGTLTHLTGLLEKGVSTLMQKPVNLEKIIETISSLEKNKKDDVILVVDDNEDDRNSLNEILSKSGYRVLTAKTGGEAVEAVKNGSFDVILLDLKLPDMDGLAVIDKIKEFKSTAGIIAITGYSLDGVIDQIISKGAYTCLLKPFNVEMLLNDVSKIVESKKDKDLLLNKPAAKILVVEDNEDIRDSMKDILELEGYVVMQASTLEAAEKFVETQIFDMVISDLSLKDKSGLLLVDAVRKKDKYTSFMLMTGYGSMETALEAIRKDVDEYVLKPVKPQDLLNKVKTYLEKSKLNREKDALMSKLKESNVKLMELSKTDELTQVLNRRSFFDELYHEMQRAKRQEEELCLMMCDIDGFKKYNDTFGHPEGDVIIKAIANIMRSVVRTYVDQVFRYGGDEFSIIVPSINKEGALRLAQRMTERVKKEMEGKGVGVSVGLAIYNKDNRDVSLNELIELADKKLYEAKKQGGGKVVA